MVDFILIPPADHIGELLRRAPSFAASPEYEKLDDEDRVSANLVFAAFAKFMEASFGKQAVVDECAKAIESLASGSDRDAHDLLVSDVFESFWHPEISKKLLLPKSRALYDRWIRE